MTRDITPAGWPATGAGDEAFAEVQASARVQLSEAPIWRERLDGKRRCRTKCQLCWANRRSPTHLPGPRCVGLSGRLRARQSSSQNRVCK